MSIKRNILASYVSQLYVTLVGIVMVPMYVRYMGAEAYGLVGFFTMLQAWFQLLDMGLTPTMSRETARFNGGVSDPMSLRRLLRALEGIFIGIACLGGIAMAASSSIIVDNWLKVQHLPLGEVKAAVMLMAPIVALRWVCGLYRGAVSGFERMVWLGGFNSLVATLRFVLVLPFIIYVGNSPTDFFTYQLAIAVLELVVLAAQTYRLLPAGPALRVPWEWKPLRDVVRFSLSIAFTSSVWVLVTQTDKLVLSKLLPLTQYAYFTLAVLVASGVMLISGPISAALLPRLTKLVAEADEVGLIRMYRNATQVVAVIATPAAVVLAFFSEQVLWAWTGDSEIARNASPVLTLYALGNGVLALAAFPYYLQFAKGDLKLHLIGNVFFILVLIPLLIWATWRFNVIGAGFAWLGANTLYFLIWLPAVHRRFVKGLHMQWLREDVGPIVLLTALAGALVHSVLSWPQGRLPIGMMVGFVSLALLGAAATGSSWVRRTIIARFRPQFAGQGR